MVWYTTRRWNIPITRQFSLTLALMACGIAPLAWLVWSAPGLLTGIGLGFAVGGAILESSGSATVFITAAVASLLGAAGVYLHLRYIM
ncbi:MAG: hypothetical protein ACREUK_00745 [Burkholderiales bacterium]